MPTVISFPITLSEPLPSHFQHDIRYTKDFVRYCLENYSNQGDLIVDPFAGFGTTLIMAEKMNRKPLGIEIDKPKVEYARSKLTNPDVIQLGDITQMKPSDFPKFDLLLTSPPYMNSFEVENPLDQNSSRSTYSAYLETLGRIFRLLISRMKETGRILIEVSNLYNEGHLTTLAWDLGKKFQFFMKLQREIIIQWQGIEKQADRGVYGYGYDHSYLLIFTK